VDESLATDMANGTAPDVFAACCSFFPVLAQEGHTLDLNPYLSDLPQGTVADWDPAQFLALRTFEGQQFGLPKYLGALALYYNKDLFDEYGVAYPDATWDHGDYRRAMVALTLDRDGDGRTDLWGSMLDIGWDRLQVHANAWGGHFVNPDDPARLEICSERTMAALRWIRDRMWHERIMASFLDVQNVTTRQAFIDQRVAMVEDGSWALRDILDGATFRIGVAPLPAGPARRVTLASTDGFGIYANTRFPEAAWELLKFLTGKEYGRAMARAHFLQPARASLVEEWVAFVQEAYPLATREMALETFAEGQRQGYSVTAEVFADMASARPLLEEAWRDIFTLARTSLDEMDTVCQRIEETQHDGS
jgi:multiple sugar transport system substrate-binding protein